MAKGGRCAVFGCNNDRWFPEKCAIKDHTGFSGVKQNIQEEGLTRRISRCTNAMKFAQIVLKTLLLRKSFWIRIHGFSIIDFQKVCFNISHRRIGEFAGSSGKGSEIPSIKSPSFPFAAIWVCSCSLVLYSCKCSREAQWTFEIKSCLRVLPVITIPWSFNIFEISQRFTHWAPLYSTLSCSRPVDRP